MMISAICLMPNVSVCLFCRAFASAPALIHFHGDDSQNDDDLYAAIFSLSLYRWLTELWVFLLNGPMLQIHRVINGEKNKKEE